MRDKPAYIRRLNRFTPADIARIRTDYQCRRESLLAIDEGVALMVEALRRSGELDNTVFVFTADNGFFQGEHRVPRRQGQAVRALGAGARADARPGHPARQADRGS